MPLLSLQYGKLYGRALESLALGKWRARGGQGALGKTTDPDNLTDSLRVALMKPTYVFDQDNHATYADVATHVVQTRTANRIFHTAGNGQGGTAYYYYGIMPWGYPLVWGLNNFTYASGDGIVTTPSNYIPATNNVPLKLKANQLYFGTQKWAPNDDLMSFDDIATQTDVRLLTHGTGQGYGPVFNPPGTVTNGIDIGASPDDPGPEWVPGGVGGLLFFHAAPDLGSGVALRANDAAPIMRDLTREPLSPLIGYVKLANTFYGDEYPVQRYYTNNSNVKTYYTGYSGLRVEFQTNFIMLNVAD